MGNIPNARNIPSHDFLENIQEYKDNLVHIPILVFHCALSQVRGPKCAQRYSLLSGKENQQKIYVLRGGYSVWQGLYKNDSDLVEHNNEEYWKDPW